MTAPDAKEAEKQWILFVQRCLQLRVRADQFEGFAKELAKRVHVPGDKIVRAVLKPQKSQAPTSTSGVDPLRPVYLDCLLATGIVDVPNVLAALLKASRHQPVKDAAEHPQKAANGIEKKDDMSGDAMDEDQSEDTSKIGQHNPPELEETIFYRVAKVLNARDRPSSVSEARRTIYVLILWMTALVHSGTSDSMMDAVTGGNQQAHLQSVLVREALAMLAVAILENEKIAAVLAMALPKVVREKLSKALSLFIPFLSQTSMQVANRLEEVQKQRDLTTEAIPDLEAAANEPGALDVGSMQAEAVMELPVINYRAGLYIFINSLLFARPLSDDTLILSYLQARYKGDMENLTTDLITASFDVLSNAMYRAETGQTVFLLRSFLINKVPTLLTVLSGTMFQPLTPEYCIRQALGRVDPNAFPSFSQGFEMMNDGGNMLSDVRQDFLLACALHHLIPEEAIEPILGEAPMAGLPAGGQYVKEDLIAQCSSNPERIEGIIGELESINGNAGAIVTATTDIIRNACNTKETMSLKSICNSLSRRPQSLDVIMQFTSPSSILYPLCMLLDTWNYEDDQGEYQPVYDEFGSILLLVLAMVYRYDISYQEIGLTRSSFVAQLLEHGHVSHSSDELTETQNKHLAGWTRGLFNPDGINDEVMSSCRPQEFYMLVPTLISQTVFACSAEVLSKETMKGGLEYLLETFLLPSLVGAINWMTTHVSEEVHDDLDIILLMATKLIRPTSISGEPQAMHNTILSIVAPCLSRCLNSLKRREPSRSEIYPLQESLRPFMGFSRSPYSSLNEVSTWAATPGPSLRAALRNTIQSMNLWSSAPTLNVAPPNYTHRQIFTAQIIMGARNTLRCILEEVKAQTEASAGPIALDIATALVCAPCQHDSPIAVDWLRSPPPASSANANAADPPPLARQPLHPRTKLNLRDALKLELEDASTLFASDSALAESAVRLNRRVEAQIAGTVAAAAADAAAASSMQGILAEGVDMTMADAVADAAAAESLGMSALGGEGTAAGGLDVTSTAAGSVSGGMDGMDGMDGMEGLLGMGDASGLGDGGLDLGVMQGGDDDDIFADLQLDLDSAF